MENHRITSFGAPFCAPRGTICVTRGGGNFDPIKGFLALGWARTFNLILGAVRMSVPSLKLRCAGPASSTRLKYYYKARKQYEKETGRHAFPRVKEDVSFRDDSGVSPNRSSAPGSVRNTANSIPRGNIIRRVSATRTRGTGCRWKGCGKKNEYSVRSRES